MDPIRWAAKGWLSSADYSDYWSRIYSVDLAPYLTDRIVAEIGVGNGLVIEKAIQNGLRPTRLYLIDPDLHISAQLQALDFVRSYACSLADMPRMVTQTALFKQSFHLIHQQMGAALFDVLQAETYVVLRMPEDVEWPLSDTLKTILRQSCADVAPLFAAAGRTMVSAEVFSYPV